MSNEPSLKRSLTWVQGLALTTGAVLGSGILVLPVFAAQLAGPASLVSWLLMGMLTVPLVITLSQLAGRWPEAGGIAAYAQRAFGDPARAVTGWLFLGAVPIGAPVSVLIGANYLGSYLHLPKAAIFLIAALMLLMAIGFNWRGITLSGNVQLGVVGLIVAIVVLVISAAFPRVSGAAFTPFAPRGWLAVGTAMTILFWAFVGWEMIGHLAEEFKHPARDIRLSLAGSLVVINLLYLLLALVTVGSGSYRSQNNLAALATLVRQSWGGPAGAVVAVLGFIACYGSVHTYVAGFSRLVYAQARRGDFPGYYAKLHPRFLTPHRVLLSLIPLFLVVLAAAWIEPAAVAQLMRWTSAVFIAIYIVGMAAALKLFAKKPAKRRPALIGLLVCLVIYAFTGWAGLYPLALAGLGWRIAVVKTRQKAPPKVAG